MLALVAELLPYFIATRPVNVNVKIASAGRSDQLALFLLRGQLAV